MTIRIERRTTAITFYDIDLNKFNVKQLKNDLCAEGYDNLAESFSNIADLEKSLKENTWASEDFFNFLINSVSENLKHEDWLDDSTYSAT